MTLPGLDLSGRTVRIMGKGRRERVVPMSPIRRRIAERLVAAQLAAQAGWALYHFVHRRKCTSPEN